MVETITPAGCGSRRAHRTALALFAVGAVGASALVGALLGALGAPIDGPAALGTVAIVALLAALREMGVLRLRVPEMRRQVPERWRREWPPWRWSLGYGAGLGAGVFTHQPVATFWVAAAGALAIGDPLVSALCLAPFGAGRALMVALPARGGRDPAAAVARLVRGTRLLRPANAAVLVAAALVLGAATATAQATLSGAFDPAASGRISAVAVTGPQGPAVVVRSPRLPDIRYEGASWPALDDGVLAYADAAGVRVLRWRSGEELARVPGPVSKPALDYPRIAYIRATPGGRKRLEVRDLRTGRVRVVDRAGRTADLGRPALGGGHLAWHRAAGRHSELLVGPADGAGRVRVIAASVTGLQVNPSLARGRVLWVEQISSLSILRLRRVGGGPVRTLTTLRGPNRILWTTALGRTTAYATRWNPVSGTAEVISRRWR